MKLTTLIEDRPGDAKGALTHEFGLSLHIETDTHRILLDTGQTHAFMDNAHTLGLDMGALDFAMISHGHFDHGGGLGPLMDEYKDLPVFIHKWAMGEFYANVGSVLPPRINGVIPRWVKSLPPFRRYIGLDREMLSRHGGRFRLINRPWYFQDDIAFITLIPKAHPMPLGNQSLLVRDQGKLIPDGFIHEIILVIREQGELVVFSGCCHNGILNIVEAVERRFPKEPIKAVVGGFHLKQQPDEDVKAIGQALAARDIPRIITGHCTGDRAQEILAPILGERLEALKTGSVHSF